MLWKVCLQNINPYNLLSLFVFMARISVGEVMTRSFIFSGPDKSAFDCVKMMVKDKVNSVIITKEKRLLGILTSTDIFKSLVKEPRKDLREVKSIDISSRKVAVIKPEADINQALEKMKEHGFRRLPVLSKGQLVGVITLKDILKIAPTLYDQLGELADIREEEKKLAKMEIEWPLEGLCDECGALSELLRVGERNICLDCREDME